MNGWVVVEIDVLMGGGDLCFERCVLGLGEGLLIYGG